MYYYRFGGLAAGLDGCIQGPSIAVLEENVQALVLTVERVIDAHNVP